MARRKRASLKDKDPETLGLTPKKGKGIDMLFGGPIEQNASASSEPGPKKSKDSSQFKSEENVAPMSEQNEELTNAAPEASLVPPAPPAIPTEISSTLPVNEADDDHTGVIASSEEFDELGLPVAMEAPPSDLEFASMPTEITADSSEKDAFDPSLSPFAAPPSTPAAPTGDLTGMVDDNDLSGLVADDDLSGLADDTNLSGLGPAPAPVPTPATMAPAFDSSPVATDDLTGMAQDDTPSGFGAQPASTSTAIPPVNLPPAPPPPTAVPGSTFPSSVTEEGAFGVPPAPVTPTMGSPSDFAPPPPTSVPPTSAATPAPGATIESPRPFLPRTQVESLGGIITEKIEVSDEDILPADVGRPVDSSSIIGVTEERPTADKDEVKAAQVIRYLGRERRENLDKEIERLYNQVAEELSVNTKDAEYALARLSEAQDIIFEDARDYDRALYLVAVVKTMLARKRNLRRWSYTWGSFVFFYALVWLIAFLAGFLFTDTIRQALGTSSATITAVRAAWLSALAGGVGGIIGIFYSLYWHVAMKQDFDRQYIMYYLVQPIMGFVLGAVVYFILGAGFIFLNFATNPGGNSQDVLASDTVVAIQIIFGWIAGFRQRVVFEMIDKIVQRILPRDEGTDANPVRLAPTDQGEPAPPPGES